MAESTRAVISYCLGWAYFLAWTISFYPQVFLNYRRKSVDGLSIDFVTLNVFGFASYTFYATNFFFNEDVRDEYRRRHNGHNNSVQPNDVAFAMHALVLASVIFLQTIYYPRGPGQTLSTFNRAVVVFMAVFFTMDIWKMYTSQVHLIDILYHLGIFKLYVSIAKYIPQARFNFNRKSTEGWSIANVLLDFTGGLLSLLQLMIDSTALNDWSAITGNPVKFGLSMLSLGFGILFIVQHFILYANSRADSQADVERNVNRETQPLLK